MSSTARRSQLALGLIRGWRAVVVFKVLGAFVGVLWLIQLTARLPLDQLGVLFGVIALFELTQHVSSLGVNSYCDRFLTSDWAKAPRVTFVRRLLLVFAWRLVTLATAAIVLAGLMPWIEAALGWAGLTIAPGLMLAYVLCEGLFRFLEIVLTATLQQVACQALLFARGLGRLVLMALMLVDPLTALDVLWVDILVTAVCCVVAMVVVVRMAIGLPVEREMSSPALASRLDFTWRSYVALLLERVSNVDVVKLLVSGSLGPSALALFGLAHAIADYAARYMPLAMFHGQIRAWLTARLEQGVPLGSDDDDARLLLRVNVIFIAAASPALVLFGEALLNSAGVREGYGDLTLLLAGMAPLAVLTTGRISLSLSAHLRQDGAALLHASAVAVVTPLWVWIASPSLGLLAAVIGCWWLELGPCLMLLRRHGRQLRAWWGSGNQGVGIVAAASVASGIGAGLLQVLDGGGSVWTAMCAYALVYCAMLVACRAFSSRDFGLLQSAIRR
ncbi:MAG: hypothetical protein ING89_16715 [Rubrivivax sp.]|nr:hypothetical protein [Rubrivivax sp.]